MEITLYVNETEQGPYSLEDVQAMLANGDITKEDFAFFEGCADWVPVADIPGIDDVAEEAAPEEEAWPEEEVAEEEAPAEAAPQAEEAAEIYVWPDGAEDWAGPHTLSAVQAMLAAGGLTDADYAAGFEGAAEGATVADIPGVHDAPVAEEAAEEPVEEEEAAPAPAKKGFKTKGGLAKKGGLSKKGGMKKAGGGLSKKGGAKGGASQAVEKGKAKSAAKKAAAAPEAAENVEVNDEGNNAKGKGLRITSGVLMILGLLGNLFVGSCSTFLGSIGELGAEAADEVGAAVVNEASEQNGTSDDA